MKVQTASELQLIVVNQIVMFYCWKWFVKLVEIFPSLVFVRLAEAYCMIFNLLPVDEQNVPTVVLDTPL